jgi:hypothetical protein
MTQPIDKWIAEAAQGDSLSVPIRMNATCDFCGKKARWTASNSFHEFYCLECLALERKESMECTWAIELLRKGGREA